MRSRHARLIAAISLTITLIAPQTARSGGWGGIMFDTFSIDRLSPEAGAPGAYGAADIFLGGFLPGPPAWRPFPAFGLAQPDEIDAITFGGASCFACPPGNNQLQRVYFSVDRAAEGLPGGVVNFELTVDGAAGDIFVQNNDGDLKRLPVLFANGGFRFGVGRVLGLTNAPAIPYSNTDAWSGGGPNGALAQMPMLFSVDRLTAGAIGVSGADILLNDPFGVPAAIAIPFAALGLVAGDDIDALDASTQNLGAPAMGDWIYFSLDPLSPALALIGAGPGDILVSILGGAGPLMWSPAGAHGLLPGDNLDALDIWDPGFPQLVEDGGFLEAHAGHRCSWPVPYDQAPPGTGGEIVVQRSASIPSPANCTVDACMVACPGGDVRFNVIVRDLANNRISGAVVELNFTQCPGFVPCESDNAYTLDWDHRSIRMPSDFAGVASFPLRGGGYCDSATVEVRVDGVFLGSRSLRSPDIDASLMVTGDDRLLLTALEGSAGPAGDFDCSGLVSGAFDPQNPPPPPPPPLDVPPTDPTASRFTVRLASNPLRAGSTSSLIIGTRAAGTVVADLHDLSGRRIERNFFESAGRGLASHAWRVPADLPAGVYSMRLRSGSEAASVRIVVIGR